MIHIYNNYPNIEVTSHYLDVIYKGLKKKGVEVDMIKSYKAISSKDIILVSNPIDILLLWLKGYRKFILWLQGLPAEESYMRNSSKLREYLLGLIDKFALKHSKFIFFVSEAMKKYVVHKYKIDIRNFYIMPCYNDLIDESSFIVKDKYSHNTFAYIGSLSEWQCFEETIKLYKQVVEIYPDSHLFVYTKEKEKGERILKDNGIDNYVIESLTPQQLRIALKQIKYGFVLRKDHPVNNVATPTKISNYMASGVIPITTKAVTDFCSKTKNNKNVCILQDENDINGLLSFLEKKTDVYNLSQEYKTLFSSYYNDEYHIANISRIFDLK